jgi:hypothetical protein
MKLSLPKKPSLAKKASRPAKPARPSVKMPPFVTDTVRDLRDRRLIIPAIALIAAIVAVPMLLRSDPEPAPAAIPVSLPDGAEQVVPAVLTEQPVGVRDYRERLDELKSKNPFKQRFQLSPEEVSEASALIETPTASTGADPSTTSSSPTTIDPSVPSTGGATEPTATAPSDPVDASSQEILILAPRIDLRLGKLGQMKTRKDVRLGDILPSREKPIVSLVAVTDDLKEASFIVSSGVQATRGEGTCSPSRAQCEFLTLKEGEVQKFEYGPQGTVHRLVVTDIREEIVDRRKVEDK